MFDFFVFRSLSVWVFFVRLQKHFWWCALTAFNTFFSSDRPREILWWWCQRLRIRLGFKENPFIRSNRSAFYLEIQLNFEICAQPEIRYFEPFMDVLHELVVGIINRIDFLLREGNVMSWRATQRFKSIAHGCEVSTCLMGERLILLQDLTVKWQTLAMKSVSTHESDATLTIFLRNFSFLSLN